MEMCLEKRKTLLRLPLAANQVIIVPVVIMKIQMTIEKVSKSVVIYTFCEYNTTMLTL
jgi:hypothetical protein